ncbi:hypothetical protein Vretimale_17757 [Volvox reticuliferus]|uniref:Transmembrane protein n=1 Tax=Volvox reticuliferus TaxID=1737510 RepID=A0A8J4GVJ0_9CHLO|nr:hypothetical protein Vretifemale_18931 [Volvox reticuliferus]GIM14888.1 hypothetical protein Vretimale_17757 [Volvox reticuliferus]
MQISSLHKRTCRGSPFRGHLIPIGSRILIVAQAKRKGVSKELRELQQLKEGSAPSAAAAPSGSTPSTVVPAVSPPSQLSTVPASSPASPTSTQTPSTSTASAAATPATTGTTIKNSGSSSSGSNGSSSGLLDNLLIRILASVAAIMAVISVFYSIVFYGASNAVYIFKDQLAAITKKDFVPYSERRRLEQEVLAKLEAEQVERLKGRDSSGEEGVPGASTDTAATPDSEAEDGGSSAELLNLLPSSNKK